VILFDIYNFHFKRRILSNGGGFLAIDTITLKSPYISFEVADIVKHECILRQGLDIKTGEVLYEITTASLTGSYDNKISIKVQENEYDGIGALTPSKPYITLEASVHKALLGHNVYGGPRHIQQACEYLIKLVEKLIQVKLPLYNEWSLVRCDVAEVYELPSFEAVQEWFKGLNAADYPRRSVTRYGLSGIYAQGSTTTLKFYHKGVEFSKHDRPRLKRIWDDDKISTLQIYANKAIRCECEIKSRKLKYDFGHLPLVGEVSDQYINNVHDVEVKRFLKEGVKMMILVSNAHEVKERLYSIYKPALAGILLGTWYQLTTLGEDSVKKSMSKPSYYRHMKQLKDACVSWHCTDVILESKHSLIPKGFSPVRNDPRRIIGEAPEVSKLYEEYGIAL
jgi:II/X family phage/plasmid replication protein